MMDSPCRYLTMVSVLGLWMIRSGALGAALHHSDTCIWRSSISPTLPPHQEARPRSDCQHGHLMWYYPGGGSLLVVFQRESASIPNFSLCLEASSFDGMLSVIHMSADQDDRQIYRIGAQDVCIDSDSSGLITLKFKSDASSNSTPLDISYHRENPP